jgi:Tfp pilus assembly protein PilF
VHTLIANNQLEQAQKTVAVLVKALPDAAPVQAAVGTVALARKDVAGARQAFARAIELDPANFEALNGLIRLDFAEKKSEAARARVDRQLAASPGNVAVLTLAARVHASTGDAKRAEELLRKVIDVDASNLQAFSMLGQLYASQNRLGEARASFEAILKERPDAIGASTILAILYETEGNRTEARKRYERVLQLNPTAAVAANNLAYIYAEDGGNLDLALQLAQTARQKLPDSPEVADTLGWVYVKKDLPTLAIPRLEEAVAKSPGSALLQYHLGVALIKAGQKIKGRQIIERALSLKLPSPLADEARQLVSEL